jgi:hypothetical protein
MKESMLAVIERASKMESLNRACICLAARGVSYRVTVKEPNVIRYWVTAHGIEGQLVF